VPIVDVSREHIEIVQGARGPKARILGSRIRVVDVVIWHEKLGMSAAEIVDQYPTITHADIYAALAYYWDNRDEVERKMADDDAFVKEFKRLHPGRLDGILKHRQVG
jgi:uncharacterized protein (DUF433 family)